jgi:PAS domain S-box-containing protein
VALSSVAAALIVTLLVHPDALVAPVFFLAIIVTAWIGGFGAGLVAAVLATLAIGYFFLSPTFSLRSGIAEIPHLLVFFVSAFLVSSWSAARSRVETLLERARSELEAKVQDRTADLSKSNEQLHGEIAERKRAQEVLQQQAMELQDQAQLLELAHDALLVRDLASKIIFWNRGAEQLYGWKKEEAIGQISDQLMQTIFPAPLEEIHEVLLGMGRWEGELTHTRRDGNQVRVLSRWSLQRDEQGRPAAILETNNDITEQKRAEEDLLTAQTELEHMTRVATLGELTASIAHEVNQPLTAVVTNGNACLRWLTGQTPNLVEARLAVERIIKDGHRASEVIKRICSLSKKAPPQKDWVDVNKIILEVIALARSEVLRNCVFLKPQLAGDLPLVLGDRIQLQQVILNLIINGVEAIARLREGPRKLIISSGRNESNGLLVAVRDTGVGLDAAHLNQIFDPFFTTRPDGIGMGLAISRSIIEAHGGRLWATSNSPQGAVFQFTLPAGSKNMS